jgi:hypothetical protein
MEYMEDMDEIHGILLIGQVKRPEGFKHSHERKTAVYLRSKILQVVFQSTAL